MNFTESTKAKSLLTIIKRQCPDDAESKLMFAIFEQTVKDAFCFTSAGSHPRDRGDAKKYLSSNMPHLAVIGIEPAWVKRKMKECGLNLKPGSRRTTT